MSTSTEARNCHESSGKAATNRERCLELVRAHPGSTAVELCHKQTGINQMNRHEISRRLPELLAMGHVVKGPVKVCDYHKTRMVTWNTTKRTSLFD